MTINIDFTTLKKWAPDYENAITLTKEQLVNYTVPENGFLALDLTKYNTSATVTLTISLNGVQIFSAKSELTNNSNIRIAYFNGIIPVSDGDILTSNRSSDSDNYGKFIPGKWV